MRRAFGCDVRSLAALRFALGLLLLADLSWRLPYFSIWLTEAGAWPISAARAEWPWSLYFLSGSTVWTIALMALAAFAAIALLVGWRTRIATIVSWVLVVSLQARNDLPTNAGDSVLRLLLFWGMFVPLGACWSVDARRRPAGGTVFSAGTTALLLQIAVIYIFNALYKSGSSWKDGSAIALTLEQETYATALGSWLLQWPKLLAITTHATWWLEMLGPVAALLPLRSGIVRGLTAFAFISFHVALFATLRLGMFPIICVVAWLPFLPSGFWNAIGSRPGPETPPVARTWIQFLAATPFALVLTYNVLGYCGVKLSPWLAMPVKQLALHQKWSLFAPDPNRSEGWMVIVMETDDGREFDALTGREVDWTRPAHLGKVLPSAFWRKYLAAVRTQKHPSRVQQFAAWCEREWKRAHPEQKVQRVRVHYLWETLGVRQDPPDHWFIYENPPGPLTEEARQAGHPAVPPADGADL